MTSISGNNYIPHDLKTALNKDLPPNLQIGSAIPIQDQDDVQQFKHWGKLEGRNVYELKFNIQQKRQYIDNTGNEVNRFRLKEIYTVMKRMVDAMLGKGDGKQLSRNDIDNTIQRINAVHDRHREEMKNEGLFKYFFSYVLPGIFGLGLKGARDELLASILRLKEQSDNKPRLIL